MNTPARRYYDSQRGLFRILADWFRYQLSVLPELPARIEAWLLRNIWSVFGFATVTVFWTLMVLGLFV